MFEGVVALLELLLSAALPTRHQYVIRTLLKQPIDFVRRSVGNEFVAVLRRQ